MHLCEFFEKLRRGGACLHPCIWGGVELHPYMFPMLDSVTLINLKVYTPQKILQKKLTL
jgi:hypothetical protein